MAATIHSSSSEPDLNQHQEALGIDIGGSGIKAAPVDLGTGELLAERRRISTPKSGDPESMIAIVGELIAHFEWEGPVGIGFPGVIQNQTIRTAANLNDEWEGVHLPEVLKPTTRAPVSVVNDADAAALCEMRLGAGRSVQGVVLLLTIGTGIGSALFVDGKLVPNMEFGHVPFPHPKKKRWVPAETVVADSARKREDLSWKKWGERFNDYLHSLYHLTWPTQIILGGGAAKKPERFLKYLDLPVPIEVATFKNQAGIVGAALATAG